MLKKGMLYLLFYYFFHQVAFAQSPLIKEENDSILLPGSTLAVDEAHQNDFYILGENEKFPTPQETPKNFLAVNEKKPDNIQKESLNKQNLVEKKPIEDKPQVLAKVDNVKKTKLNKVPVTLKSNIEMLLKKKTNFSAAQTKTTVHPRAHQSQAKSKVLVMKDKHIEQIQIFKIKFLENELKA